MTSEFILDHGEEFVQCPYNSSHRITNLRVITHLSVCRSNYLKELSPADQRKIMRICRFNALHHIPAPEIHFHEKRCKDATRVVTYLAHHNSAEGEREYENRRRQESAKSDLKYSSPSKTFGGNETKPNVDMEEEDWETEASTYTPGYDPNEKLKSEVVLYNPAGLTKSERKHFRSEVRVKASEISFGDEDVKFPIGIKYEQKPDTRMYDDITDEPQEDSELTSSTGSPKRIRRDGNNESYYSASTSRDKDFDSGRSDGHGDRNYGSSAKDSDKNYPTSSPEGYDDDCNASNRSPDHDSYYSRNPGNDDYRPHKSGSQHEPASCSGSSQQTNCDNTTSSTQREIEYTDDRFEGYDPFKKGVCEN